MSDRAPDDDATARSVREAVEGLADQQPHVSDWPAAIRRRVARRRARRSGTAGVLVAAAVAAVAVGAGALPTNRSDALIAGTADASPPPSRLPTPSTAPPATAPPSAAPSPAATAYAPPATAEPEPMRTDVEAPARTAAPSWPPFGTQQIRIDARPSDSSPVVGEELVIEVTVTGNADRQPFLQGPRIDDSGPGWIVGACPPPDRDSSGSPPPAQPQTLRKIFRHTFDQPGRHELAWRADSSCSYYRGDAEHVLVVDVQPSS